MRNIRFRNFSARWLACALAGFALVVSAQSPAPDQNPDPNAPVAIPPDALAQPPSAVQPPPAENWDHPWRFEKLSEDDDWTRHFRLGALVGMNISANFKINGHFNVNNQAANGTYDDGYVRTDDTGNAGGQTGNWGYNDPSQLSGSQLTMHSINSYDTSSSSKESGSAFVGFDMAYGGNICHWGGAKLGWEFGFGLLPISLTDKSPMSGSVSQTTYVFNTGTIVVPGAPYQGGPSGVGEPTITNNFNATPATNTQAITGSHSLDVMLYTMRLGPSMYWDLNQYFGLSAGVGPALGIVSGNMSYDETIGTVHNKGRVDGTDLVYGGYVNATLMYHLVENGDLYLGVQYMSLGKANISGGGRSAQLNLNGQVYISAGINWPF